MNDNIRSTIATLATKVEEKAKELAELKRTVNFLSKESGGEPIYQEELEAIGVGGPGAIRPDEYYGKPPVTAAREYLERRGQAVPADEILAALVRGGFDFPAQGWKKSDRLRSLAISLSKNSLIFHKLPNGTYGLVKFYPDVQAKKQRKGASGSTEPEPEINQQEESTDPENEERGKA